MHSVPLTRLLLLPVSRCPARRRSVSAPESRAPNALQAQGKESERPGHGSGRFLRVECTALKEQRHEGFAKHNHPDRRGEVRAISASQCVDQRCLQGVRLSKGRLL